MTNNKLIEIINKAIDDIFCARIDFNKIHKDDNVRDNNYDRAYYYQVREQEDVATRDFAKGQLHRFIQSLDLDTDDSPYEEMWKGLLKDLIDYRDKLDPNIYNNEERYVLSKVITTMKHLEADKLGMEKL